MAEVGIDITAEFPKPWTHEIVRAVRYVTRSNVAYGTCWHLSTLLPPGREASGSIVPPSNDGEHTPTPSVSADPRNG